MDIVGTPFNFCFLLHTIMNCIASNGLPLYTSSSYLLLLHHSNNVCCLLVSCLSWLHDFLLISAISSPAIFFGFKVAWLRFHVQGNLFYYSLIEYCTYRHLFCPCWLKVKFNIFFNLYKHMFTSASRRVTPAYITPFQQVIQNKLFDCRVILWSSCLKGKEMEALSNLVVQKS